MSLKIIKKGILDTIQDLGRYGYQHLGINSSGAMDRFSAQLVNALLGKKLNSPVIEMHFPAASILFQRTTLVCITGADFSPQIGGKTLLLSRPFIVNKNRSLNFHHFISGARCYLSVLHDLKLNLWLNSFSTNIKACAGGWYGRSLADGDEIEFTNKIKFPRINDDFTLLPWGAVNYDEEPGGNEVLCIQGNEWNLMTEQAQQLFKSNSFSISHVADRMGYRLAGDKLNIKQHEELISSAVSFGTVQLPPDGLPIVLMADHQTTGGYPRIAHVISAHLPRLAQMKSGDAIKFKLTDIGTAEEKLFQQRNHLLQVQAAAKAKLENLVKHVAN